MSGITVQQLRDCAKLLKANERTRMPRVPSKAMRAGERKLHRAIVRSGGVKP